MNNKLRGHKFYYRTIIGVSVATTILRVDQNFCQINKWLAIVSHQNKNQICFKLQTLDQQMKLKFKS